MHDALTVIQAALADRYAVQRELGHGGMATVYLAEDLKHRRPVAVKVLRPELAGLLGRERFLREIEIAGRLQHPHILPLYDSGVTDGLLYYVMPYVPGESLRHRLQREGQLPVDEALRIVREVADALGFAHSHDVVHRDIKPENILLEAGHAVVSDFGIARAITAAAGDRLTVTGVAIGTPAYMSPEQGAGSRDLDGRSDLYSLGCVLYEMLAGHPPFVGATVGAVINQHVTTPPPTITEFRPTVPADVAEALAKVLNKAPADRYSTAAAFMDALAAPAVFPLGRQRAERPKRSGRFRGVTRVLAALSAFVLLGTGIVIFREHLFEPEDAYAVDRPRQSFMILPFSGPVQDSALAWLVDGAASMLGINLEGWRDLRVVGQREVEALSRRHDLAAGRPVGLRDAIQVAKEARVGTLVVGEVLNQRGAVEIVVRVYDVASGEPLQPPERVVAAPGADFRPLFDQLAARILTLTDAPTITPDLRAATTSSLEAYRAYLRGQRALNRWMLDDAVDAFRVAIALDSSFSLAYHRLGVALSWRRSWDRDEVRKLLGQAVGHADRLPWRERQHVLAANAFLGEDYELARQLYQELIAADSTDAEAWFFLADVEYHDDEETKKTPDNRVLPRSNLNTALRGFERAVDLDPKFHLGYGHLFDLLSWVNRGSFAHFRAPGASELRDAEPVFQGRVYFYPAWRDSAFWVRIDPRNPDPVLDRFKSDSIVDILRERAIGHARRWANAAPDESQPHVILRDLYVERRAFRRALEAQQTVLRLEPDTFPARRAFLGALHLAVGAYDSATRFTEEALRAYADTARDELPPSFSANAFLARGQPSHALDIMARRKPSPNSSWILTPEGEVPYGDSRPVLWRLQILGSAGSPPEALREAYDSLMRIWSPPRYTAKQIARLVENHTYTMGNALLALGDTTIRDWFGRTDSMPSNWRAYLEAHQGAHAAASATLDRVVSSRRGKAAPFDFYLLANTARLLGRHALALDLFAQMDTSTYSVDGLDGDWGLLSLSYLQRGWSYAALGQAANSRRYFERFLDAWSDPDPDLHFLVTEARQGLARLQTDR